MRPLGFPQQWRRSSTAANQLSDYHLGWHLHVVACGFVSSRGWWRGRFLRFGWLAGSAS